MKRYLPWVVLSLCLAVGIMGISCNDDDDDDTVVVVEEAAPGDPDPAPAPQTLGSGTKAITSGGPAVNGGTVSVPGAGKIIATVSWPEGGNLTVYFKKSDPTNYGWVQGGSPLTSVVDGVAAGEQYTFYLANTAGPDVNATYTITFDPD